MNEFSLPTTLTTLSGRLRDNRYVAHCLDFDLLEIANTDEEAWSRLTRTIKTYVEFGLSKGWNESIRHRAPQHYWDALTPDVPVKVMPPIMIANISSPVIKVEATHEALCAVG